MKYRFPVVLKVGLGGVELWMREGLWFELKIVYSNV